MYTSQVHITDKSGRIYVVPWLLLYLPKLLLSKKVFECITYNIYITGVWLRILHWFNNINTSIIIICSHQKISHHICVCVSGWKIQFSSYTWHPTWKGNLGSQERDITVGVKLLFNWILDVRFVLIDLPFAFYVCNRLITLGGAYMRRDW